MLSLRVQRGLALFQKVQKKENAGVSSRRKPLSSGCARSSLTDAGRLQDDTALSAAQAGRVPRLPAKGAPPGRTAPPQLRAGPAWAGAPELGSPGEVSKARRRGGRPSSRSAGVLSSARALGPQSEVTGAA